MAQSVFQVLEKIEEMLAEIRKNREQLEEKLMLGISEVFKVHIANLDSPDFSPNEIVSPNSNPNSTLPLHSFDLETKSYGESDFGGLKDEIPVTMVASDEEQLTEGYQNRQEEVFLILPSESQKLKLRECVEGQWEVLILNRNLFPPVYDTGQFNIYRDEKVLNMGIQFQFYLLVTTALSEMYCRGRDVENGSCVLIAHEECFGIMLDLDLLGSELWTHEIGMNQFHHGGTVEEVLLLNMGFVDSHFGSSGEVAAVKRSKHSHEGKADFIAELAVIVGLNLIQLQGWCVEKDELFRYEFIPYGCLDKRLYQECERQVIHGNINTSNVMLDENFNARLCDFILTGLMYHDKSPVSTLTTGPMGYLALHNGKATQKIDIFNYGVVILELACGKRPIERDPESQIMLNLVDWILKLGGEGKKWDIAWGKAMAGSEWGTNYERKSNKDITTNNSNPHLVLLVLVANQLGCELDNIYEMELQFWTRLRSLASTAKNNFRFYASEVMFDVLKNRGNRVAVGFVIVGFGSGFQKAAWALSLLLFHEPYCCPMRFR